MSPGERFAVGVVLLALLFVVIKLGIEAKND